MNHEEMKQMMCPFKVGKCNGIDCMAAVNKFAIPRKDEYLCKLVDK